MKFIRRPDISVYSGVRVTKNSKLEFKNEHTEQTIENLVLHSVSHVKGDGYESVYDTTIYLEDGDILIFEEEGRGFIKPVESFVTIEEAISDLEVIKDMG